MKLLNEDGSVSEELQSILANSNDLMFVKNTDFVYIAATNGFVQDCTNLSSVDELIGKTDFDLYPDPDVASYYRKGDEEILASDEDMLEFSEDFIDKRGKKYRCATAKYVLHDPSGKQAAILGQYHQIDNQLGEQLMRNRDQFRKASIALSKPFFVSNYVDLKTHLYRKLWAMEYVREMMKGCETAEEGFDAFIQLLVKPEYQDTVRKFGSLDTLPERLKDKKQIDCEYRSNVASGWCRISFYPADWDASGNITAVLFTVTPVDENLAREIDEGRSSKKNLQTIFDEVPGGIILYQWNGKELKILRMSRYYQKLYGYSMMNTTGTPDFQRVHPDDISDYQKAIYRALTETHSLEYVFRAWNQARGRYGWTKINAISKEQPDGTSLVYAIYTDVTDQKVAELRLQKANASIATALGATEQFIYEYDPVQHTSTCFTDAGSEYSLEKVIRNYPECFRTNGFCHPDDIETFIDTVHRIDAGADSASCLIRARKGETYRWHSCSFDAINDSEKGYRVALLTVVDVTAQVTAKQDYDERIHFLMAAQDDIFVMCTINATKNTFELVQGEDLVRQFAIDTDSFEDFVIKWGESIVDSGKRKAYLELFSRENLLLQAESGRMTLQQEYLMKISDTHYEWVTATVNLVKNLLTNETGGVAYVKSSQKAHMEHELLSSALKKDYIFSAVVFKDTDEFYIYNAEGDSFGTRYEHFWEAAFDERSANCSQETIAFMKEFYSKEQMLQYLETNQEFSYAFDSSYDGTSKRLETKFRYLDAAHTTLLVTLRDITDSRLQEEWRYRSEHDALTGTLNRKTVFEECRKLLDAHPDTQFAMMHCDVQHFHLYNTFFGEQAGDRLLKRIAHVMENLAKEYCCYTCGRIESDVFCAFFPYQENLLEKQIRLCFREMEYFSPDFPLQLAIGVYMVTDREMSIESMFSRATIAAKSHKDNLFGKISRYDEAMEEELRITQQITSEMTAAIEQEQFEVYLQPKVSLRSAKIAGAEALVRWNHPERGLISPGRFIPVFEQNGFIAELDRYMWEHTCQILYRWQTEKRQMQPISVNLSRISLYSHATVPFLKSLTAKYGLDPKWLELELTETAYMDDPEDLKRMLRELQEFGFRILMDDFGSGYSSLTTLRELPVDVLKLDMKFLTATQNDRRGNAILSSVVRMSKLLNLPIVAEGVETQEQADYLRDLGCEYAQGYLFYKPVPVAEYERILKTHQGNQSVPEVTGILTEAAALDLEREFRYDINTDEMIQAIDNTGIRMFLYFPQTKIITVPEKTCEAYGCASVYANMPQSFADDYVHPDDYAVFREMYRRIDAGEKTADALFHSKDFKYCNHVTLTTVNWTADGKPLSAFGLIEDQSAQYRSEQFIGILQERLTANGRDTETDEILKNIAGAISSQYYAVYYIWLQEHSYVCLQEKLPGVLSLIGERGNYEKAWDQYISDYIEPSDQAAMREFIDLSTIEERLTGKPNISHIYRRKAVGWTRGQFIACSRDEQGGLQTFIYTVTDINLEVENDQKRLEAEEEALHDQMTGLLNRKAFQKYCASDEFFVHPVGLMLFDIDRFKAVNDQYGHTVGDHVIQVVSDTVKNSLRRDDRIFRVGGDEFAVLLYDCKESIWNSLCRKIGQIHADVRDALSEGMNITISAGLCVRAGGYVSDMYQLADKALYHTKANGRGGCTMISLEGEILSEWHDRSTVLRTGDVLEKNSTVTWRVEMPKRPELPRRAFGDDLFMNFIGAERNTTPEEMFRKWFGNVEPGYADVLRASMEAAVKEGSAEAVYRWKHPERGVLQLRCSVSFESETDDYLSFVGYVHVMTGTRVITLEGLKQMNLNRSDA